MPRYGVMLGLTTRNSWPLAVRGQTVRMAYVATDSTDRLSFVTVQPEPGQIAWAASRPTHYEDMPHGVVIELHMTRDITDGEQIQVMLAQSGATTYFPPQQIDDLPEA